MKKIFLVILNWNGWKMTQDCLASLILIEKTGLQIEIVVLDNGSSDGSPEKISLFQPKIENCGLKLKIIRNDKNLGFARGNNIGIEFGLENKADYICLLNNDTRVDRNFLIELVATAESKKEIGLVGGKIYFERGYEFHKDRYRKDEEGKVIWCAGGKIDWENVYGSNRGVDQVDEGQYDQEEQTDYVNGCLMLVKKEVFGKIGYLDPKYFLYYEDTDFSVRAKKAGFDLVYCPKAKIWHLNSGSSGSGSGLHDYFITRNRLLFGMRHSPWRSKAALIKESLKLLFSGRKWQKIGVRDFYLGRFEKGSWVDVDTTLKF